MCSEKEMKTEIDSKKLESSLSNSSKNKTVFLQTLRVIIRCQGPEKLTRAVIDSGSQSTYVSENVITHLKALPLRSETVIHMHSLGGSETKPKKHDIFPVEVSNLNKTYTCSFEALSEKMICGYILKIEDKQVLNELKRKKIKFTDSFRRETEINLLISADVLGKLLTGNSVELESGLTAVEIKLGISSPTEIEKQKAELSLNDFNNKMKILPDGRYEVELPWKYDSLKLPSNKELVWKRHEGMINRFGCGKFFIDYQKVFKDWEKLNIIEPPKKGNLL
ncbi:uncharacterized protein TNCV_1532851 [Trichonephila clavipes]|nr:uncharacterized protein TNCV_1532851 [Trichonephila clavipes]